MNWIQTFSGYSFDFERPSPTSVCIEDIAHALSCICRFNGHARRFYSVAEHSIRVAQLGVVPEEYRFEALMHDAHEAYIGDMTRPLKAMLSWGVGNNPWETLEHRVRQVLCSVFGLAPQIPHVVKVADDIMLATEARDLMTEPPAAWCELPEPHWAPIGRTMTPEEAEARFLAMFEALQQGWKISDNGSITTFEGWAIIELMGHSRTAGKISQGSVGGLPAMRLDIYAGEGAEPIATQFFTNASAFYRVTPSTEEICRRVALANKPQPVHRWELPALTGPAGATMHCNDPDDEVNRCSADDFDDDDDVV